MRWFVFAALVLLAGAVAFAPLVMRTKATAALRAEAAPARVRLMRWAMLLAAVAFALEFVVRLLDGAEATRDAVLFAVQLALLGGMALVLRNERDEPRILVAASAALILTQSLSSRSASRPEWVLPVLADWIHFTFAAVWLGGVAYFAIVLVPVALRQSQLLSDLGATIEKFSPLAILSVLVVGLTGIMQSASFVGSFEALLNTDYGRALLVKTGLFAVLIGFGAFHQFVISPQLRAWRARAQSAYDAARRFRISIAAEAAVSALTLAAAAAMTVLPTANLGP
ncbi:MAG: CopD family protein [Anaerolineae bacterium]|nr:CopD family protein [Candidatus Roseilinea sp.]MDW8449936.1 CopD family protein [Anaerolineae bacterium]